MNTWSVIGSGPSGHELTAAELGELTVIVVNTAVAHVPHELIDYHLFRHPRLHRHFDSLVAHGVKLVSFRDWHKYDKQTKESAPPKWMDKVAMIEGCDELLQDRDNESVKWTRGTYTPYRDPIGPQALQFAINHGATSVYCWGLEGGPWRLIRTNSDELPDAALYHRKALQAVVDECPDVEFVMYGELLYELTGENVRMEPRAVVV